MLIPGGAAPVVAPQFLQVKLVAGCDSVEAMGSRSRVMPDEPPSERW